MNEALKRRLIGAILLVGVIVIVLASLLGGHKHERKSKKVARAAPTQVEHHSGPQREHEHTRRASDQPSPPQRASRRSHPEITPPASKAPVHHAKPELSAPKKNTRPQGRQMKAEPHQPKATPNKAESTSAGVVSTQKAHEPGDKAAHLTPSDDSKWVVQAASFRKRARAEIVVHRLTKKGFHAFIDQHSVGGRPAYRVRVGPVHGRNIQATLARQLRQTLGHDVLAVRKE